MSKRAERRDQRTRMVRRAWIRLERWGFGITRDSNHDGAWLDLLARRRADNFTVCSCPMCCNKRRGWEAPRTRAEERQLLELKEWLTWG